MTQQQRDALRVTWPLVALTAIGALFFLGIFALVPRDMPEGRTALLGLVTLFGTGVVTVVVQRLNNKVDQVQQQTNGHMGKLIQAKTTPDVSRETSGRHARDSEW